MFFKHLIYLLVGVCALSTFSVHADERGAEVVDKLQREFEDLKTLTGRFVRKHYWQIMDQKTEVQGRLYVQRPKQFRFETRDQTVVTDGVTAWNYAQANEQVLISAYDAVEKDRSYEKLLFDLILLGGYAQSYNPQYAGEERVDGERCYIVELTAKQDDTYIHRIRLWIDRGDWVVRQVEYHNLQGDVTTYELSDLKIDKRLDDDTFRFNIPKNVEAIDLR